MLVVRPEAPTSRPKLAAIEKKRRRQASTVHGDEQPEEVDRPVWLA
jgi:hypothetical protein